MTRSLSLYLDRAVPYLSGAAAPIVHRLRDGVSKIGFYQLAQIAFLYQLYDSGIANILALETNRHGTSLYSYIKIHLQGVKISKGRAFVYEDDESLLSVGGLCNRLITPFSASFDSINAYAGLYIPFIISIPLGLISPVVKFRFTPEQLAKDFKEDTEPNGALYPEKDIGVSHLGITGSLMQGLNPSILKRIYSKPTKFLLGCAQLVAAIALTCIVYKISTPFFRVNLILAAVAENMERHRTITKIALCGLNLSTW